ncbi:helix-turn-helix domain-containing protein [Bariatricus sp. HCP28S3_A7]|uniref:helix-turn-helix domain-containing protein n=1 Tax=Bariatricus sp. HCP28S3_A7 TaxID=3438894 RepID=UPI003F8B15A7
MDFGKQIRQIRKDAKLTQEQMAAKLNVSRQAVSNWENNKNLPDLEMIITISRVFGLSMDQLMVVSSNL